VGGGELLAYCKYYIRVTNSLAYYLRMKNRHKMFMKKLVENINQSQYSFSMAGCGFLHFFKHNNLTHVERCHDTQQNDTQHNSTQHINKNHETCCISTVLLCFA